MKTNSQIPIVLFLAMSLVMTTACGTTQTAKNNQPNANANAAQSSNSQSSAAQSNSSPAKQSSESAPRESAPRESAPRQPAASTRGTIEVSSVPPGARVLLVSTDEAGAGEPQSKGLTPTSITGLQPGKYTVDLEKTGYKFFQKQLVVKEGAVTKVNASLKKG